MSSKRSQLQTKTVYIEAHPTIQGQLGPKFAMVLADKAFLDQVLNLRRMCVANGVLQVMVFGRPTEWGPENMRDILDLNHPALTVTPTEFWFVDQPQNAGYAVITQPQNIARFLWDVSRAHDVLFLGNDETKLKRSVEKAKELENA